MKPFRKEAAARMLGALALEAPNRDLADHWLSLCTDDALPARDRLAPAKLKSFLPNILLFDTVPEQSVVIRLAGTRFHRALNIELTGQDWIALAPQSYRAERLRLISTIARGAVGVGHRRVALTHGETYTCEEILLPFAADRDGLYPVLVHVNFAPAPFTQVAAAREALGDPLDFKVCALN